MYGIKRTVGHRGADVALQNGGGVRADINIGEITKGNINAVLPFGNTLVIKEITAAQLKAVLEQALRDTPNIAAWFPQVAGISVVFDPVKPAGEKVVSIKLGANELDLSDTTTKYKLATNDFMANGGDGFTTLAALNTLEELGSLDTIFENYIVSLDNSTITGNNAKVEGRVKVFEELTVKLVNAVASAKDFISIKETSKNSNVWVLSFRVTETYSDGTAKVVPYAVQIKANNANIDGNYNLGAYTLIYDVKGNGSNIKEFRVVLN